MSCGSNSILASRQESGAAMHLEKEERQDFLIWCYQKIHTIAREQCHCRQCDSYCNLFSNICEHCGRRILYGCPSLGYVVPQCS